MRSSTLRPWRSLEKTVCTETILIWARLSSSSPSSPRSSQRFSKTLWVYTVCVCGCMCGWVKSFGTKKNFHAVLNCVYSTVCVFSNTHWAHTKSSLNLKPWGRSPSFSIKTSEEPVQHQISPGSNTAWSVKPRSCMKANALLKKFDSIFWGLSLPSHTLSAHTENRSFRFCVGVISASHIKEIWATAWPGCEDVISNSLRKHWVPRLHVGAGLYSSLETAELKAEFVSLTSLKFD